MQQGGKGLEIRFPPSFPANCCPRMRSFINLLNYFSLLVSAGYIYSQNDTKLGSVTVMVVTDSSNTTQVRPSCTLHVYLFPFQFATFVLLLLPMVTVASRVLEDHSSQPVASMPCHRATPPRSLA